MFSRFYRLVFILKLKPGVPKTSGSLSVLLNRRDKYFTSMMKLFARVIVNNSNKHTSRIINDYLVSPTPHPNTPTYQQMCCSFLSNAAKLLRITLSLNQKLELRHKTRAHTFILKVKKNPVQLLSGTFDKKKRFMILCNCN